jgi:hypothetical protein
MSNSVQGQYRLSGFLFSALAFVMLTGAAHAAPDCKSLQKGNEIFSDTFVDATGGWVGGGTFGKPALALNLAAPNTNWTIVNDTFNATEGDYCMQAVLPTGTPSNKAALALITLFVDNNDFLMLQLSSDDSIGLYRLVANNWNTVATVTNPDIKPTPGSVVTLRMTIKGSLVTSSINGIEVKKVRVQIPTGPLKFGIYAQVDQPVPSPGVNFQYNFYRVTSGE